MVSLHPVASQPAPPKFRLHFLAAPPILRPYKLQAVKLASKLRDPSIPSHQPSTIHQGTGHPSRRFEFTPYQHRESCRPNRHHPNKHVKQLAGRGHAPPAPDAVADRRSGRTRPSDAPRRCSCAPRRCAAHRRRHGAVQRAVQRRRWSPRHQVQEVLRRWQGDLQRR